MRNKNYLIILGLVIIGFLAVTPIQAGFELKSIEVLDTDQTWDVDLNYWVHTNVPNNLWWHDRTEAGQYPTVLDPTVSINMYVDWLDQNYDIYDWQFQLYNGTDWATKGDLLETQFDSGGSPYADFNLPDFFNAPEDELGSLDFVVVFKELHTGNYDFEAAVYIAIHYAEYIPDTTTTSPTTTTTSPTTTTTSPTTTTTTTTTTESSSIIPSNAIKIEGTLEDQDNLEYSVPLITTDLLEIYIEISTSKIDIKISKDGEELQSWSKISNQINFKIAVKENGTYTLRIENPGTFSGGDELTVEGYYIITPEAADQAQIVLSAKTSPWRITLFEIILFSAVLYIIKKKKRSSN